MSHKRSPLPVEVLQSVLTTLLGVAIGILTSSTDALPEIVQRHSLPLAVGTMLLIIVVTVWQHRADDRRELPPRPDWDSKRSPFPGLEAFTKEDSAVVGPSGAGKSSLVQAGVVPRLLQRRGDWIVVPTVVPGDHPLRNLARSLAAAGSAHPADEVPAARFADELRTAHGRPNAPVLVIVDQAEELITLSGPTECDAFLALLARALDADPRLWIIMITRSEFLTTFLGTEQARLFRDPVAVGTLSHAALIEVIEQPARRAGLIFDPPTLPQRMAADAYQRIGGVTGVLTRQADKVAAELGSADRPVPSTLLTLTGQSGSGTPNPATRSSSSACRPGESKACRGPGMAIESPLLPGTELAEFGMRRSASSNSWPTPAAASPGN